VALEAVGGALSLLPHTARLDPARLLKREETILETRDIFVLKLVEGVGVGDGAPGRYVSSTNAGANASPRPISPTD